jgi:hypothetical protein
MRQYATIYYLLFVLLIMGAFASMAQNPYGLRICGVACIGFAFSFLHELLFTRGSDETTSSSRWTGYAELVLLSVLVLIFSFANFSINFPFSETLLIVSFTGLLLIFAYQAIKQLRSTGHQRTTVYLVIFYYGAIVFFILSFLTGLILPGLAMKLALVGIVLTLVLAGTAIIFKQVIVNDETISVWQYVRQMKNKASILLIASLLISGYELLNAAGILPSFYHGTPKGYQHLIELSNSRDSMVGKEKPLEFKERYDEFTKKHATD